MTKKTGNYLQDILAFDAKLKAGSLRLKQT